MKFVIINTSTFDKIPSYLNDSCGCWKIWYSDIEKAKKFKSVKNAQAYINKNIKIREGISIVQYNQQEEKK